MTSRHTPPRWLPFEVQAAYRAIARVHPPVLFARRDGRLEYGATLIAEARATPGLAGRDRREHWRECCRMLGKHLGVPREKRRALLLPGSGRVKPT